MITGPRTGTRAKPSQVSPTDSRQEAGTGWPSAAACVSGLPGLNLCTLWSGKGQQGTAQGPPLEPAGPGVSAWTVSGFKSSSEWPHPLCLHTDFIGISRESSPRLTVVQQTEGPEAGLDAQALDPTAWFEFWCLGEPKQVTRLPGPQFPHLQRGGGDCTYLPRLPLGSKEAALGTGSAPRMTYPLRS